MSGIWEEWSLVKSEKQSRSQGHTVWKIDITLLQPFYSPLDCIWDYLGELVPER